MFVVAARTSGVFIPWSLPTYMIVRRGRLKSLKADIISPRMKGAIFHGVGVWW
jgi:hypothetical protein